jgi:hypothetical protein
MPGFLPSEVKTYQYAANLVYDELIDKYGAEKVHKFVNINKIKQAVEKARVKGMSPHEAAEKLYNGIDNHIKGVKKIIPQATKQGASSYFSSKEAAEPVKKAVSKLSKFGKITGGLALATTLIYGSYQVYKHYLSAAAKACAHRSGNERKDCIDRYRTNARKEQIKKLQHHLQDCIKSKDPLNCKKIILRKIQQVEKRTK